MRIKIIALVGLLVLGASCMEAQQKTTDHKKNPYYSHTNNTPVKISNAEWKNILTSDQYYIAREQGTERAYTGKYWDNHKKGMYYCGACGHPLFSSETKFDSGTGWPSFYQPLTPQSVAYENDGSAGMERTEVQCARCHAHLGHVFDDGPKPTGKRFCMDGNILDFEAAK